MDWIFPGRVEVKENNPDEGVAHWSEMKAKRAFSDYTGVSVHICTEE